LETLELAVKGIVPQKGKFVDNKSPHSGPEFYTVEPSPEEVVGSLISSLVGVLFYHALLESKASEHSARMIAMKNASDKSRDLSKALTRTFNKARQAMITREVSEIVGGIEAMAAK
jgi:F-type H+-transporting ATPase subunit gamma